MAGGRAIGVSQQLVAKLDEKSECMCLNRLGSHEPRADQELTTQSRRCLLACSLSYKFDAVPEVKLTESKLKINAAKTEATTTI